MPGWPPGAASGPPPWMVGVNLPVTMLHAPYVRSFKGFQRPWQHLEQMLEDVQVRELALGSGYILTGQAPPQTVSDSWPLDGHPCKRTAAADLPMLLRPFAHQRLRSVQVPGNPYAF